jgi:hypothetical protein
MVKRYWVLLPVALLLAAGCASSYRPAVDPTFTTDSARYQKDRGGRCRWIRHWGHLGQEEIREHLRRLHAESWVQALEVTILKTKRIE